MYTFIDFTSASNTSTGAGSQFVVDGTNVYINNGGIVPDDTSVALVRLQTAFTIADTWAEIIVEELDTDSDIGVILRTTSSGADTDSTYYMARINNGRLQLLSKTSTGSALIGLGSSVDYDPSVGDVLRLEIHGTTLSGSINSTIYQSVTVSSIPDATAKRYCGIRLKGSLATKIRSVRAGDYGATDDNDTPPTAPTQSSITNGGLEEIVNGTNVPLIFEGISDGAGGVSIATLTRVTVASTPTVSIPNAPTNVTATPDTGSLSISCTAPANNGATITDYVWSFSTTSASAGFSTYNDGISSVPSVIISGRASVPHWVRVAAVNSAGISNWSTVTGPVTPTAEIPVTPDPTAPSAPASLSVTPGPGSLVCSFTAPANNGSAITDYVWSLSTTSSTTGFSVYNDGISTSTSTTLTGRALVPQWVRVAAVNSVGTGPFSVVFGPITPSAQTPSAYGPNQNMTDAPALPAGFTPIRTINVSNAAQLTAAFADATAGDLISLAANTMYTDTFTLINKSGTAQHPIIIRGPRSAVLNYKGTTDANSVSGTGSGYGLHLDTVDYIQLSGFTIRNVQKGIMADIANHCTVEGVEVHHVGDEAVHFRNYSSDNLIENCTLHHTGNKSAGFGEGLYFGNANSNWGKSTLSRTNGEPDTSNRNIARHNYIHHTTGECIDIKEGTTDGLIEYNYFGGESLNNDNYADTWIDAKGNNYTIQNNYGLISLAGGYSTSDQMKSTTLSGYNNIFKNNKGDCRRNDGTSSNTYGINIANSASKYGNIVYSDNVLQNTAYPNAVTNISVTAV